jgi:Cdc6-like AAA superfamily ATPase
MASISQTIQREINPFDSTTFRPGNFWQEQQNPVLNVESIHQEAISDIKTVLDQVASDHRTRTLMLYGDSGSGKSHLLGRLKRQLNSKAFFAYIGPWPDSDFIWRHILRQAVDSLLYAPEGQKESQLLLWLKGLPAFKDRGFVKWVLGERGIFIRNFRTSYPTGIYNAKEFFGVLYDLTNPELYPLACDWLRGDLLDEDDLKALGVRSAIDTEDAAQKILANFGKISAETQPIVLCFDQLDNIPRLSNGFIDLQALFSVNSSIHNEHAKNFLVIISIITNTWKENAARVQSADKARLLDASVSLKPITLDEAEASGRRDFTRYTSKQTTNLPHLFIL